MTHDSFIKLPARLAILFICLTVAWVPLPTHARQSGENLKDLKQKVTVLIKDQKYLGALPFLEQLVTAEPNNQQTYFYPGIALIAQANTMIDAEESKALRLRDRKAFLKLKELGAFSEVEALSVCDNLHPDLTKEVRIRAIYRVGFEWAELYSLKCVGAPRIWVDFSDEWRSRSRAVLQKEISKGEGTYGVIFVGKLGGSGGHMGAYPLTLQVTAVESATRLGRESVSPHALSPKLRRRVESFEATR